MRRYRAPYQIEYWSARYQKSVTVFEGYESDGATGAFDIRSEAWWVHDVLCEHGTWGDGTPVTGWQAANVLRDILLDERHWVRAHTWFAATWLFGCSRAAANGRWPWSHKH